MYLVGNGVAKDESQAAKWFRKSADQGNGSAQVNLGILYAGGRGVPKDDVQAAIWFRKSADQGNAVAQFSLGTLYAHGRGVPKDDVQAAAWYRKAAEQGQRDAQLEFAKALSRGRGVAKDDRQAAAWLRKAADQGVAAAQSLLAFHYQEGRGVERDVSQAAAWLRKAAEQGNATAQWAYGQSLAFGELGERDLPQAVTWFRKAADQGHLRAQHSLGVAYASGVGIERDPTLARRWLEKAAEPELGKKPLCVDNDRIKDLQCLIRVRDYGLALELGLGAPPDRRKAREIYQLVHRVDRGIALDTPLWTVQHEVLWRFDSAGSALQYLELDDESASSCNRDTFSADFQPKRRDQGRFIREFDVSFHVVDETTWPAERIRTAIQGAADIFAACGIRVGRVRVVKPDSCEAKEFDRRRSSTAIRVKLRSRKSGDDWPSADGTASGIVDMPLGFGGDRDDLEPPFVVLAHELGHLLGLYSHPADFEPSVMQYGLLASQGFTADECKLLGSSSRLLPPRQTSADSAVRSWVRPKAFTGKHWAEIVESLRSSNKYSALFYAMRNPWGQMEVRDFSDLDALALKFDVSWREILRLYEYAHNYRPEMGWVDERTDFDLNAPSRIFWLPDLEERWSPSAKEKFLRATRARLALAPNISASLLDSGNSLGLSRGQLLPPELQATTIRIGDYKAILVGGDLVLYGTIPYSPREGRLVLDVYTDFLNLFRGANLDQVRGHARYDKNWERARVGNRGASTERLVPTSDLRSEAVGATTPSSLPGGKVVAPIEAWQLILAGLEGKGGSAQATVLSAIESYLGPPTAIKLPFAGAGGSFRDETQAQLSGVMTKLAPNKDRTIITYCYHENCWLSYNMALRLIALGYRDVRWLREGLREWAEVGLPLSIVQAPEQ